MQIYLPIAEIPVDIFLILFLGAITGLLSGMFGVGGGFLVTPLLIFIGIPPAVAVSSSANQIIAASFSGFLVHFRRDNVDFKIGLLLLAGGWVGSTLGVALFALLKSLGQIDLIISLTYVIFLGFIGSMMAINSYKDFFVPPDPDNVSEVVEERKTRFKFIERWRHMDLPFMMDFPKSQIHASALTPIAIGVFVGILASLMGIGGGFVMIPAMLYILRMPTHVVIGTSLFQIIFVTANVTILQALNTHTVDIILASLLIVSSVAGAQFGTHLATKLSAEHIKGLLALMLLSVAIKLALGLFIEPSNLYEVTMIEHTP